MFPSWVVKPIKYENSNAEGEKRVFVVPFELDSERNKTAFLSKHGLKPCLNGPSYLMGLMVKIPKGEMPEEIRDKFIVAAEPDNPSSIFLDEYGRKCFLYTHNNLRYRLLIDINFDLFDDMWALLAESA